MESAIIRQRLEFEGKHYAQAAPVLRRWRVIGLSALRIAGLIGILLAFLTISRMVQAAELAKFGVPLMPVSWVDIGAAMIPYVVMIPFLVWAWYRARQRAMGKWLEQTRAAGVSEAEFSAEGMALVSDRLRMFYRWGGFTRVVNRRGVFVLFLHPRLALIIPKGTMTAEEEGRVVEWSRAPGEAADGAAVLAEGISFEVRPDYADFREVTKLIRGRTRNVRVLVRRWVAVGFLAVGLGFYFWGGWRWPHRGPRDAMWYWDHFGFLGMVGVVWGWTLAFWLLQRWMTWSDQRATFTRPRVVTLDDAGMRMKSAEAEHVLRWDAFNRVTVGKRVVLAGLAGGTDIALPFRQMPGGKGEEIVGMLERQIVAGARGFPVVLGAQ